jgi:hypothetical protein
MKQPGRHLQNYWPFVVMVILQFLLTLHMEDNWLNKQATLPFLANDQALRIKSHYERIRQLNYVIIPLLLFIKYGLNAAIIQTGLLLQGVSVKFSRVFRQVVLAGFFLFGGDVLAVVHLSSLPDLSAGTFQPHPAPYSLSEIMDISGYAISSIFVFNKINVFEMLWGASLCLGIKRLTEKPIGEILAIILPLWCFYLVLGWSASMIMERLV